MCLVITVVIVFADTANRMFVIYIVILHNGYKRLGAVTGHLDRDWIKAMCL